MRKLYLVGVMLGLGCSSSSGSNQGAVDPAALDFCLHWANDVCHKAYLCVDATAQDAAFHTRYGQSEDDCWQSVEKYCTSNQTGTETFGPSCGAGKKVNTDLASACTDSLESESCATWTLAPAGNCNTVCSTASNTGGTSAGGTSAGGTGGTSAGGTSAGGTGAGGTSAGGTSAGGTSAGGTGANTGPLATATDFCNTEQPVECERYFECDAATAAAAFGTLAACKALVASACASGDFCPGGYDASQAAGCVAAVKTATCTQLMGDPPAVCTSTCQQ